MKEVEKCEFESVNIDQTKLKDHNKSNLWICARTLTTWFRDFRMNREKFINVPKRRSLIDRLPPIFDENHDMKDKFVAHAKQNIINLTPELMYEFCNDTLIPNLVKQVKKETGDESITKDIVLKKYRMTKFCICTLYNWMHSLGFEYCNRKKQLC